jgi:hypothetical protein
MPNETQDVMDLLMEDLDTSVERLYVAALRFVRVFDRDLLEGTNDSEAETIGNARQLLVESAMASDESFKRCETAGWFGPPQSPPEELDNDQNAC